MMVRNKDKDAQILLGMKSAIERSWKTKRGRWMHFFHLIFTMPVSASNASTQQVAIFFLSFSVRRR
jgi:hypothetical protein